MYQTADFVHTVVRDRTSAAMGLSKANQQFGLTPTLKESMARVASWFLAPFRIIGVLERRTGERRVENVAVAFDRRTADRRVANIVVPLERRVAERRAAAA